MCCPYKKKTDLTSSITTTTSSILINPPAKKHIVLLFDDINNLDALVADYINEGLKRGQFCVYASVYLRDGRHHMEKLSILIDDYKENVRKENLLVVDLAPLYISALIGDVGPFEEAKKLFVEKAKGRADKHVRFVGDATGFLFRNCILTNAQ